jgi:hypothetical protein
MMQREARRNPCSDLSDDRLEILREIAKMQMGHGLDYDSKIMDRARNKSTERFRQSQERKEQAESMLEELSTEQMREAVEKLLSSQGSLEEILEGMTHQEERLRLESEVEELSRESQGVIKRDFDDILSEFGQRGLTDARKPKLTLTSKGAQLLGKGFLGRPTQDRGSGPRRHAGLHHPPLRVGGSL